MAKSEEHIKTAFELNSININFDNLIETAPRKDFRSLSSYRVIFASLKEVGLLEALTVSRASIPNKYYLIHGHLRLYALKELGYTECPCIISKDNERYTYDVQVNYINPLERSRMIKKAVRDGLSTKKIAETLAMDEGKIIELMAIVTEIDPAAAEILKDCRVSEQTLKYLARVKPFRQVHMAQLMYDANNFNASFAKALYLSTDESEMLVKPKITKKSKIDTTAISNLNAELERTSEQLKDIKEQYEINVHSLITAAAFIRKILENENINDYISRHFQETHSTLINIVESETILS